MEVGDRANLVRIDMMQIEHCSFYISREQAENLHRSFSVIKSSQQGLILIFEEYYFQKSSKIVIGRWRLWAVLFHHPSIMVWA